MPKSATSWKAGQSGNPGGRPKALQDVVALCREETEANIRALVRIRNDPEAPAAAVVAATTALLDRGWGKPVQRSEHTGADGGPIKTEDVTETARTPLEVFVAEFAARASVEMKH